MLRPYIEVFFFSLFFSSSRNPPRTWFEPRPARRFSHFPSFPPRLSSPRHRLPVGGLLPRTSRSSRGGARDVVSARRRPRHRGARGGGPAGRVARGPRVPAPAPAAHQRVPADGRGARPGALAVLGETHAARLAATDTMCLAVIGIAAGAEQLADLRRHPRPTLVMTAWSPSSASASCFWRSSSSGRRVSQGTRHGARRAGEVAAGARGRALSASAIAVLREMDARGPFCQHVVAVTVARRARRRALRAQRRFAALANLGFPGLDREGNERFREGRTFSRTASVSRALLAPRSPSPFVRRASPRRRAPPRRGRGSSSSPSAAPPAAGRPSSPSRQSLRPAAVALWPAARSRSRRRARRPLLLCVVAGGVVASTPARRRRRDVAPVRRSCGGQPGLLHRGGSSVRFDRVFADTNACLAAIALFAARLFALFHARPAATLRLTATRRRAHLRPRPAVAEIWLAMITQAGVAMGLVKSCGRRFATTWGGDRRARGGDQCSTCSRAAGVQARHRRRRRERAQRAGAGERRAAKSRKDTG